MYQAANAHHQQRTERKLDSINN